MAKPFTFHRYPLTIVRYPWLMPACPVARANGECMVKDKGKMVNGTGGVHG